MLYRPTAIGGALFRAASTLPYSNHPLARKVRSNITLHATSFSVAMPDKTPRKHHG